MFILAPLVLGGGPWLRIYLNLELIFYMPAVILSFESWFFIMQVKMFMLQPRSSVKSGRRWAS